MDNPPLSREEWRWRFVCRERGRKRERREGEFVPKIYQKVNQKSSKNQPKIDQEETENPPKINFKFVKNQSWRGLGGVLGPLGSQDRKRSRGTRFLGPSWDRLGGLLGRLGGLLGPSWRSWRPLGPVLGSSWRPKSDPKSTKYRPKKRSEL